MINKNVNRKYKIVKLTIGACSVLAGMVYTDSMFSKNVQASKHYVLYNNEVTGSAEENYKSRKFAEKENTYYLYNTRKKSDFTKLAKVFETDREENSNVNYKDYQNPIIPDLKLLFKDVDTEEIIHMENPFVRYDFLEFKDGKYGLPYDEKDFFNKSSMGYLKGYTNNWSEDKNVYSEYTFGYVDFFEEGYYDEKDKYIVKDYYYNTAVEGKKKEDVKEFLMPYTIKQGLDDLPKKEELHKEDGSIDYSKIPKGANIWIVDKDFYKSSSTAQKAAVKVKKNIDSIDDKWIVEKYEEFEKLYIDKDNKDSVYYQIKKDDYIVTVERNFYEIRNKEDDTLLSQFVRYKTDEIKKVMFNIDETITKPVIESYYKKIKKKFILNDSLAPGEKKRQYINIHDRSIVFNDSLKYIIEVGARQEEVIERDIDYKEKTIENNELTKGIRKEINPGKKGYEKVVISPKVNEDTGEVTYEEKVIEKREAEDRVVEVGTKIETKYKATKELPKGEQRVVKDGETDGEKIVEVGIGKGYEVLSVEEEPNTVVKYVADDSLEAGKYVYPKETEGSPKKTTKVAKYTVDENTGEVIENIETDIIESTPKVIKVGTKSTEKEVEVPFETEYKDDYSKERTYENIDVYGKNGVNKEITKYTVDENTGKIIVKDVVIEEISKPSKQIVTRGTLEIDKGKANVEEKLPEAKIIVFKDDKGNTIKDFPIDSDEKYKPEKEIEVDGKKYEYIGKEDDKGNPIYKEKQKEEIKKEEIDKGKANVEEKLPEAKIIVIKDDKGNTIKDFPVSPDEDYKPEKEIEVDDKKYEYIGKEDDKGNPIYKEKQKEEIKKEEIDKGEANVEDKLPEAKIIVIKDDKGNVIKDFPIAPDEEYKTEKEIEIDGKKYEYIGKEDGEYIYKEKENKELTTDKKNTEERNEYNKETISENKEDLPKTSSSLLGLLGLTAVFGIKKRRK